MKILKLATLFYKLAQQQEKQQYFIWDDQLGSRDRSAWLLLIKNNKIYRFTGSTIPSVVTVVNSDYTKDGKWSKTKYKLKLFPNVKTIAGRAGWNNGTFVEGLREATKMPTDRWVDVANALGVSLSEAMNFLREWKPKAADKLDEIERSFEELEDELDEDSDAQEQTITFGSPRRKLYDAGYWTWPVTVIDENNNVITKLFPPEYKSNHEKVKIINVEKTSGMKGGFVSIRAIMPDNFKMISPQKEADTEDFEETEDIKKEKQYINEDKTLKQNPFSALSGLKLK